MTALLAGEAGIGKSRLVAEMKGRALHRGMAILEGHCFETERVLPYAPLLDLLRALPATCPADDNARALGPVPGDLAALLPELAALVPRQEVAAPHADAVADPEREKRRTFRDTGRVLLAPSRRGDRC